MAISNKILLILIVFSVACSSVAQLLLKSGMARSVALSPAGVQAGWQSTLASALTSPLVLAGLALYAFGALVWLLVLARAELSFAYPFVGLGFVMTLALGKFALGEDVSLARVAGTLLVVAGVILIARGNPGGA
jgi:multidrug transporter EmrE-like cation transporter